MCRSDGTMKVNIRPHNRHAATTASEPSLEHVMDAKTASSRRSQGQVAGAQCTTR